MNLYNRKCVYNSTNSYTSNNKRDYSCPCHSNESNCTIEIDSEITDYTIPNGIDYLIFSNLNKINATNTKLFSLIYQKNKQSIKQNNNNELTINGGQIINIITRQEGVKCVFLSFVLTLLKLKNVVK